MQCFEGYSWSVLMVLATSVHRRFADDSGEREIIQPCLVRRDGGLTKSAVLQAYAIVMCSPPVTNLERTGRGGSDIVVTERFCCLVKRWSRGDSVFINSSRASRHTGLKSYASFCF